jgi:hypothetical protein
VESPEPGAQSLFLRALPEDGPDGVTWRGYVVLLPNGAEHYFRHLSQVPEIVFDLLADEGADAR